MDHQSPGMDLRRRSVAAEPSRRGVGGPFWRAGTPACTLVAIVRGMRGTPALPEMKSFSVVSASQILSRTDWKIYDVTTGAVVRGGIPAGSALAGKYAIYTAGSGVFLTPY